MKHSTSKHRRRKRSTLTENSPHHHAHESTIVPPIRDSGDSEVAPRRLHRRSRSVEPANDDEATSLRPPPRSTTPDGNEECASVSLWISENEAEAQRLRSDASEADTSFKDDKVSHLKGGAAGELVDASPSDHIEEPTTGFCHVESQETAPAIQEGDELFVSDAIPDYPEIQEPPSVVEIEQDSASQVDSTSHLEQSELDTDPGAFSIQGERIERRVTGDVSSLLGQPASSRLDLELSDRSLDVERQLVVAAELSRDDDVEARVEARLGARLEEEVQRVISQTIVPAETVVTIDDHPSLDDDMGDSLDVPTTNSERLPWKMPAVLVLCMFVVVAAAIGVVIALASTSNGNSDPSSTASSAGTSAPTQSTMHPTEPTEAPTFVATPSSSTLFPDTTHSPTSMAPIPTVLPTDGDTFESTVPSVSPEPTTSSAPSPTTIMPTENATDAEPSPIPPTENVPSNQTILPTEEVTQPPRETTPPTETVSPTETVPPNQTIAPTEEVTQPPTEPPTEKPSTKAPTESPTESPTTAPLTQPPSTLPPTQQQTNAPTIAPTIPETDAPTDTPTYPPTDAPTENPTDAKVEEWTQLGQDLNGRSPFVNSGWCVSLSEDASVVAVGAPAMSGTENEAGYVRVYHFNSETQQWQNKGQDLNGTVIGNQFGVACSINSAGDIVAVGATGSDVNGENCGSVHIYKYDTGLSTWEQLSEPIYGEAAGDEFGMSVSLSSTGLILAAGAHFYDGGDLKLGHVRVYQYDYPSSQWQQIGQTLIGKERKDKFGTSVALNRDGDIIAIGAVGSDANGQWSGQVVVLQYSSQSSTWDQLGQAIDGESPESEFGNSVALSEDGYILAAGAHYNDNDSGLDSGSVRVYQYDSDSLVWNQLGQDVNGEARYEIFGEFVSLSKSGHVLAAGAPQKNNRTGRTRVFRYNSDTFTWEQVGQVIDGVATYDHSGFSGSLNGDGSVLAIGAMENDGNGDDSGHARVFVVG